MINPIRSFFNVLFAIILGISVDHYTNKIFYNVSGIHIIIIQIIFIIIVITAVDFMYSHIFGILLAKDSIFFIAIFLGVQGTFFKNIDNLYVKYLK